MSKIAITIGTVLLPGIAAAHPEHGPGTAAGAVHYLTDPFHVGLTMAGILAALTVGRSMLGRRARATAGRRLRGL
jgi:hypothetical protein